MANEQNNKARLACNQIVRPARTKRVVWIWYPRSYFNGCYGSLQQPACRTCTRRLCPRPSSLCVAQRNSGLGISDFDPLNGRYGEIRCFAKSVLQQLQTIAASAAWLKVNVGKVRKAGIGTSRSELPLPAYSYLRTETFTPSNTHFRRLVGALYHSVVTRSITCGSCVMTHI